MARPVHRHYLVRGKIALVKVRWLPYGKRSIDQYQYAREPDVADKVGGDDREIAEVDRGACR